MYPSYSTHMELSLGFSEFGISSVCWHSRILPSLRAEVTPNLLQTIVIVSIEVSRVHHVASNHGDLVSNQPMRRNDR